MQRPLQRELSEIFVPSINFPRQATWKLQAFDNPLFPMNKLETWKCRSSQTPPPCPSPISGPLNIAGCIRSEVLRADREIAIHRRKDRPASDFEWFSMDVRKLRWSAESRVVTPTDHTLEYLHKHSGHTGSQVEFGRRFLLSAALPREVTRSAPRTVRPNPATSEKLGFRKFL